MATLLSRHPSTAAFPAGIAARAPGERATRVAGSASRPLASRIRRAFELLRNGGRRRAAINELNMLSDRELADIGLNRGDVGRVFDPEFAAEHRDRG